jgi:hypothetical protein
MVAFILIALFLCPAIHAGIYWAMWVVYLKSAEID